MEHRADIQGLRAYAVLAVMLFHFGVPGVSGGFIGVDVFFVLSGFLMTGVILKGIESGQFSLVGFYAARARRILPALTVLCIALLVFGWWWLAPVDYATLGQHSASAIGFFSNFIFMDEDGYFDAPSKTKWLLHSWSLAVEWQFYLLYPLVLLALTRLTQQRRHLILALALLAAASLLSCIYLTVHEPAFAFYTLPTRAWELLAGSLAYLLAPTLSSRRAQVSELAGLAAIVLSATAFDALQPWPGAGALLPVIGTVLVLNAARSQSLWTRNAAAQAIGRWSYSIYLWHWPVVVGLSYFALSKPGWLIAGFIASILLGAASYRWVEQPARRIFATRRAMGAASALAIACVMAAGFLIQQLGGVPSRVPESIRVIDREISNRLPAFATPCGFDRKTLALTPCIVGDADNIRWVVWGDSHAGTIVSAVAEATHSGVYYYTHACVTMFDVEMKSKNADNHCTAFNQQVAQQIAALPRDIGVIVINRYSANLKGPNEGVAKPWGFLYAKMPDGVAPEEAYRTRMSDTLCQVAADGRAVYAVGPIPEMGRDVPRTMLRLAMTGHPAPDVTLPLAEYHARNDVALAALAHAQAKCGVTLLDPTPYLCREGICHGAKHGKPLYFDDDHLTESGNRALLPLFAPLARAAH